jgi:hypothetical protein
MVTRSRDAPTRKLLWAEQAVRVVGADGEERTESRCGTTHSLGTHEQPRSDPLPRRPKPKLPDGSPIASVQPQMPKGGQPTDKQPQPTTLQISRKTGPAQGPSAQCPSDESVPSPVDSEPGRSLMQETA